MSAPPRGIASPGASSGALPAVLAILAAQVSVNLGAALAKDLFARLGPEAVVALRTSIAALLLLALIRPDLRTKSARQWGWIGLYALALGGMNLAIYEAFARLPIGIAVGIEICGPLAVALLGARGLRELAWPVLAACGLVLLVPWPGRAHALDPVGLGAALAAATCWALYILFGRKASGAGGGAAVALGMLGACLVTVPAALLAGKGVAALPTLAPGTWGKVLGVALLSSAVPYFLEMQALARLPARVVGLICSTAPAIAALVGYLVLGETLTPLQALAIALLIAAGAGCSLQARTPA